MSTRIALYLQDKHPISYELEMARYAEERGITEIWQADTRLARDCVVMMSALLAGTGSVRVGSGVLPIWTRNPAVIAATWSTMWELAGQADDGASRVMLGLVGADHLEGRRGPPPAAEGHAGKHRVHPGPVHHGGGQLLRRVREP